MPSSSYANRRLAIPRVKAHRHALPCGYRLLWYRTERVLGQGGFGITYLATDTNLDRQVALKEYLPIDLVVRERDDSVHPITDDRAPMYRWGLDRFAAEARALARFKHPNIVQVHTVFEANNTAYMVMAYEQGHDLDTLFSANRYISEKELLALIFPLLDGLEHMHAAGFIHRDIKPSNIYVRTDGSPVLLDFGSARMALGTQTRTLTGLVTPGYAPYEQYGGQGDRQGPWGDIYALGATLYRAVAGKPPADAILRGETRFDGRRDPLRAAVEVGKGKYSRRFLMAIDEALRFSPSERPQDIASWRRSFPASSTQPVRRQSSPRWLRITVEFGALGAIGILLGLGLVILLLPEDQPATTTLAVAPTATSPRASAAAADESLQQPKSGAPMPRRAMVSPTDVPPHPQERKLTAKPGETPTALPKPKPEERVAPAPKVAATPPTIEAPTPKRQHAPPPKAIAAPPAPDAKDPLESTLADYRRALQYTNGEGVRKDDAQAAVWFRKAAEEGYAEAQYQLGVLHDLGKGVTQDPAQAAHWYQKAAAQGVIAAQHNLAVLYDRGKGIQSDPEEAARWYAKAAARGLPAAQTGLALLYENGRGVPQDYEQAARWYRAAAVQGGATGQYNLGLLYEHGKGVRQDFEQAFAWYQKAANEGLAPAQFSVGALYDEGKGVEQDYQRAAQWYQRAAEQGYDKAQANLGYMYGMGHGVPQDARQAYAWFALAATRGNRQAQRNRDLAADKMSPEALREAQTMTEKLRAQYGGMSR